ncbi:lytic murein transglycosylase B [Pokkaliibacter sp. MBI-7]|uniref:lytic murein transglycosylase B n=1 Tax=Pokkaliibacter sp. MBI-7 TaxID=3040600 RepID=UPI00244C206C|nr:lytic murein transglycosylase B [Pokkaliibacter sp. MBI-7]MDH2431870.1 lytic murein transglycosylase B [Pokkaliibacter sp. MBI-7]
MGKARLYAGMVLALSLLGNAWADGYADYPEAQQMAQQLDKEGIRKDWVLQVLSQAERKDSILEAISKPAERRLNWSEYRKIFLTQARINKGVAFWNANESALSRAEAQYGVPAEVIVAIIGVETSYGGNMGNYRVVDALSTLGFDYPKRGEFFRKELANYLRITYKEKLDPLTFKGSYAGAMGYGQFMPSSYLQYAVDFNGDGVPDIWEDPVDAIGSVANYFAGHGWVAGGVTVLPVMPPAGEGWKSLVQTGLKPNTPLNQIRQAGIRVPDFLGNQNGLLMALETDKGQEYWLGLDNFYVITRYNHSRHYAMAVYQLAHEVKMARDAAGEKSK